MNPTHPHPLLETLNPSQREAVLYDQGHLLIVAGPGTGKTHTLIHRMSRWIPRLKPGQQLLALTFTHKAADEIAERLNEMIMGGSQRCLVGTFHRFCLQLLGEHLEERGLPEEYQIVDEMASEEIAKALWPQMNRRQRRDLLNKISRHKSVEFEKAPFGELQRYNDHLRDLNFMDYDDVLLEAARLLEDPGILGPVRSRFPYIFIDEYQDVNPVQHRLLLLLAGPENAVTAIGDPQQAIYGFRGSDVRFFQSFPDDFRGAKVLCLTDNYRSGRNILTASHQVIAELPMEVPALTANIFLHGDLIVHPCPNENAEAEYVVRQIEKLVGGTSMFSHDSSRVATEALAQTSFDEIAVVYRLNSMAGPLREAFDRSGIPFHVCADEDREDDICPQRGSDVNIEAQKVSLMTIHAAKGLEFDVVFIIGCEEHLLPLQLTDLAGDLNEERRLFYVGMTRAKKRLYFTHAKRRFLYGRPMQNHVSRFLMDIEEGLKRVEIEQRPAEKRERQMKFF